MIRTRLRIEGAAWAIAALAGVAVLAGLVWMPHAVYRPWLGACAGWLGWPLGSMALILTHALTGGRWGEILLPALRAGVATLPLGVPALAVLLAGAGDLYPWLNEGVAAHLANRFYLNPPFALLRIALYAAIWGVLGVLCLRGQGLARIAPAGLILLALTFSFASIDLTESLDPGFSSSAYGLIAAAGAGLLALALATLLVLLAGPPRTERRALRVLARLLLGLTVLWAYLDFMQFLIIWQSDLPVEAAWYGPRLHGRWGAVAVGIVLLHFLLPFALLMLAPLQVRRPAVLGAAGLLVVMEVTRNLWLVLPGTASVSILLTLASLSVFAAAGAALCIRAMRREVSHG
ncbi:hypothetical protein ACLRDC_07125 [Gluconacetobacter sacchari]|uniref:Quinol:cytochrome c oxidoreductase quinone-binding subunit 2 n=2 Tax=Gluconacetobacter sacchari TaxID=92759 RepID=A0A7W4IDX7_9PROT|nr:hypothetical protein [Gluconacetobacter sacchari]MBB2161012.1 hypothetical protein [Gluconacetobacter sacchari]GBQ24588.1 hypothetical protein AA12717_1832 [Gluconacetobacter sacchari DSM 12717]